MTTIEEIGYKALNDAYNNDLGQEVANYAKQYAEFGATEQQKIDATQFSLAFCDAMCGAEKRGICDMRRVTCTKLAKFLDDGMKEE